MVEQAGGISVNEFWALVSPCGLWLNIGESVTKVLGRTADSVAGTSLLDVLPKQLHQRQVLQILRGIPHGVGPSTLAVEMMGVGNETHPVTITFYPGEISDRNLKEAIPVVCQVKLLDHLTSPLTSYTQQSTPSRSSTSSSTPTTSATNNLFEELDTTRHTSWQYELTHLRISNKNLLDEIAKLEIQQGLRDPDPEVLTPEEGLEASGSRSKKRSRPDTESTGSPGTRSLYETPCH
jgi:hypothetical protein